MSYTCVNLSEKYYIINEYKNSGNLNDYLLPLYMLNYYYVILSETFYFSIFLYLSQSNYSLIWFLHLNLFLWNTANFLSCPSYFIVLRMSKSLTSVPDKYSVNLSDSYSINIFRYIPDTSQSMPISNVIFILRQIYLYFVSLWYYMSICLSNIVISYFLPF